MANLINSIKTYAKRILKPLLANRDTISWTKYSDWESAVANSTGYDAKNIFTKKLEAARLVEAGEAIYERDTVLFSKIHYSWPVLASLMMVAAQNSGKLSVLDFGGSFGSTYRQNKKFWPSLSSLQWGVVEQAEIVRLGQKNFSDPALKFFKSIDDCSANIKPNVALFSSVLQYLDAPYDTLRQTIDLGIGTVIIDRTPFTKASGEIYFVQKVPTTIYTASYACRYLCKNQLKTFFRNNGYKLLEQFECIDGETTNGKFKGLTFIKDVGTGPKIYDDNNQTR